MNISYININSENTKRYGSTEVDAVGNGGR